MKILMISTDRGIFNDSSDARKRIIEYGSIVDELHVVIFSERQMAFSRKNIAGNVWLYPTDSRNRWHYIRDSIKIGKKIITDDKWLVTTQDPFETGVAGWRVAVSKKVKLHLQVHTDFLSPFFSKGSILNKIRVRIAKFLLPRADCVRVVSNRIKDSIISTGVQLKSIPVVLPIFVDIQAIRQASVNSDLHKSYNQFDYIILMVSRLESEKNIPMALSAFKKVIDKYPHTGLVILGNGSQHDALMRKTKALGLKDNVVFKGNETDPISYYKTADIFLHTSNYEGYGMAIIEAAASDCRIVTTDVGIASDYFKDTESAFICQVGDSECIAGKLIELIGRDDTRDILVMKAQNSIENNLTEKTKGQYLASYKDMWSECCK